MPSFNISYIYEAVDKFTPVAEKIKASVEMNRASFEKLSASMQTSGRAIKNFGKSYSLAVTAPITAMTYLALRSFDQQANALAQVEVALNSTKGRVGLTLDDMAKMANDFQKKTLYGDEAILSGVTAQLLSFRNISGDVFKRTQAAVLDVAARQSAATGGMVDLRSVSLALGKALNDPIRGMAGLSRMGIQFTAGQKKMIEGLVKSGKQLQAQDYILKVLKESYGGAAEAAARVGTGPIKQLMMLLDEMLESYGEIAMEFIAKLLPTLKKVTDYFSNLSPTVKRIIVGAALLAAALGPVIVAVGMITLGIGNLIGAVLSLSAALPAILPLALPFIIIAAKVALIVAMIATLVYALKTFYDAWDDILYVVGKVADKIRALPGVGRLMSAVAPAQTGPGVAAEEVTTTARLEANINLAAPRGVIKNAAVTTSGTSTADVGLNMAY